jgi:CrcB protein
MNFLWVALGGAIGSILRYSVGLALPRPASPESVPISTLFVNGLGCFLIGLLFAVLSTRDLENNPGWLIGAVGLLGGFTTFSTFGLDTLRLVREGYLANALLYVCLTLVLTLVLTWIGFGMGSKFTLSAG